MKKLLNFIRDNGTYRQWLSELRDAVILMALVAVLVLWLLSAVPQP